MPKALAFVPCNLTQVKRIIAHELERQMRNQTGRKVAEVVGLSRPTLIKRVAKPHTFTVRELDVLMPWAGIKLQMSLMSGN